MVPPPDLDLPPRPVPKAPLTDVVPKRTLVVIVAVVVLAVLGTVLAFALGDSGDEGKNSGAKPAAGASAKRDEDAAKSPDGGARTDGASSAPTATGSAAGAGASPSAGDPGASADSTASGSEDGGSAPAESTRKGDQGYSIGLPKGWKYQTTGRSGDRYTGPRGQKLLVAWTGTPKDDPVADWRNQERYMVRSQYHKVRIEKVDYRGWNTADWEFTYVDDGTEFRTIDRGFVVNDHLGYALMYTARDADWHGDLRKDTWKTLTKSFRPKS